MSRKQKIKHMTQEELKTKLFAHLQKNGSFDQFKSQMRGQLISELFKVSEPVGFDEFPKSSDIDKRLLPIQVCNWLVYDHLLRQDYQYSLSTFVTEVQLPFPEKFLTAGDILDLLGLNHIEIKYEHISKLYSENNELGHLHSLLLAMIKTMFNVSNTVAIFNQTVNVDPLDISQKEDIKEQNQNFLDNKLQQSSDSPKLSLEKGFPFSSHDKSMESSFHEQLQVVKEENEKEVQRLRHRLLKELENLHQQEHKMQLEIEYTKAELRKEQAKLLKETELLKEKELILEKEIAHKFEQKMRDAETDHAMKLHLKDKEIEALKMKLTEKEQKFLHTETELFNAKDKLNIIKQEQFDMKHMFKVIQDKYSAVLEENTNLLRKFENMADYAIIKEELAAKTQEVLKLQQEIRNIHCQSESERKKYVETVRSLEDTLNIKEPELIQTRKELEYVKNTLSKEEGIWDRERKKLEYELNEFKELYKNVIQRVEDQKEDIQDLHKTIHTLNYKFTNNTVNFKRNENTFYRNLQTNPNNSAKYKSDNLFSTKTKYPENSKDLPLEFLSNAKSRFNQLKQEEDNVQEKCSYIFSTIPESNKYPPTFVSDFNLISSSKTNMDDYNFHTVSKPTLTDSAFNFDDWSKSKLTAKKTSYSLSDIKQLVTRSLFSYKTNAPTNIVSDFRHLEEAHKSANKVNDWFKSTLNKPSDLPVSEKFVDLDANKEDLTSFEKLPSQNNESTIKTYPEQTGTFPEHSAVPSTSLPKPPLCERPLSVITSGSNDSTSLYSETQDKQHPPKEVHKNDLQSDEKNCSNTDLDHLSNQIKQTEVSNSSQNVQNEQPSAVKNSNIEPINTVFVNLDDAWKRRTSNPPTLASLVKSTNSQNLNDKSGLLFEQISAPNNGTKVLKKNENEIEQQQDSFRKNADFNNQQNTNDSFRILTQKNDVLDKNETEALHISSVNISQNVASSLGFSEQKNSVMNYAKTDNTEEKNNSTLNADKSENISENAKLNPKDEDANEAGSRNSEEKENEYFEKRGNADSLSELSEIHLSCGSEPEQQKEDSDAW